MIIQQNVYEAEKNNHKSKGELEHELLFCEYKRKYDPGATDYNKQKKEVIIYGDLKDSISKLKQGDGIFLYQKKVGIVAFGVIENDNVTIRDWGDDKMYSKDLCNFIDFSEKPIKFMAQGGKLMGTISLLNEEDLKQIREKAFEIS